jgi:SAM-dependent methyltransferase
VIHETWWGDRARHFETLTRRDEWTFETPVERERHRRVREAVASFLGLRSWGRVLEVGCADGCFTAELARLARSVTACDISPTACQRARERCRAYRNVHVRVADVIDGPLAGPYDVVFAMDVLDYVHGRWNVGRAVGRLVRALRPGGLLVVTTFRVPAAQQASYWARWLVGGGENLRRFVERRFPLRVIHRDVHAEPGSGYPDHVVLVFRKAPGGAEGD